MASKAERNPGTLRIASAAVAALIANVPWLAALVINCGEPPYPTALCTDRADPIIPWELLVLVAPTLVLIAGVAARRAARPLVFEVTWIVCVVFGFLALVIPAVID